MNSWKEQDARDKARQVAQAVAEREQGRRRLNATTVTVTVASVAAAGLVAAVLPGTSHAATKSSGSAATPAASATPSSAATPSDSSTGASADQGSGFSTPASAPQYVGGGGANVTSGGT